MGMRRAMPACRREVGAMAALGPRIGHNISSLLAAQRPFYKLIN